LTAEVAAEYWVESDKQMPQAKNVGDKDGRGFQAIAGYPAVEVNKAVNCFHRIIKYMRHA